MLLSRGIREALEIETGSVAGMGRRASTITPYLERAHSTSILIMYCAAAMTVILFALMIYLILQLRENVPALTALSAIFGTSIAGLIAILVRMARVVTQAGVLLGLASQLSADEALGAMKAILAADAASSDSAMRKKGTSGRALGGTK